MTAGGQVSEREAEVLALLGARMSNAQIAGRLHVSVRTVEGHVSSLLRKYGVADRRALGDLAATVDGPPSGTHLSTLPSWPTTFVGRHREIEAVAVALADNRLVTLLGPAGVGKTRLAATCASAAAPRLPFGGAFVDLVPARPGSVTHAVAAVLGAAERPQQTLHDAVLDRLGIGRRLLVLDNCEHVVDAAAAFVEAVLAHCPETTILVTSRERLGIPGEQIIPVAPLPLGSDAETLFYDRAAAVQPDFTGDRAAFSELCARLDGLPLAIELAAARVGSLGVAGLLSALGDYLRLLAGGRGREVRHRSLRAVIGWSHDLLDGEEQTLFRRLGIFTGRFDLAAAAAVSTRPDPAVVADVLGRLVDKSLIVHQPQPTSWRMLATVRAFAVDALRAGDDLADVEAQFVRWAASTADALENRLDGPWRDDFDTVADDLRAALAIAAPQAKAQPHRLARTLAHLCFARRFPTEAHELYRLAATLAPTPHHAAQDLLSAAYCVHTTTKSGPDLLVLLTDAAAQARAAGDSDTQAIALAHAVETICRNPSWFPTEVPYAQIRELLDTAETAANPDDPAVAAALAAATAWAATALRSNPGTALADAALAVARRTGDPVRISASLDVLIAGAALAGRPREAHRIAQQRLDLANMMDRHHPRSAAEIVDSYTTAAYTALGVGDFRRVLDIAGRVQLDDLVAGSSLAAAMPIPALVLIGDLDEAQARAKLVFTSWQRPEHRPSGSLAPFITLAPAAYALRGDSRGHRLLRAQISDALGVTAEFYNDLPSIIFSDILVALHTGDLGGAAMLVARAFDPERAPGVVYETYLRAAAAELAVVAALPDAGDRLAEAASTAEHNDWAAACLTRAHGRLYNDLDAITTAIDGWQRLGSRLERAATQLLHPRQAAEGRAELAAIGIASGLPHNRDT